jgi:hypothetical protein
MSQRGTIPAYTLQDWRFVQMAMAQGDNGPYRQEVGDGERGKDCCVKGLKEGELYVSSPVFAVASLVVQCADGDVLDLPWPPHLGISREARVALNRVFSGRNAVSEAIPPDAVFTVTDWQAVTLTSQADESSTTAGQIDTGETIIQGRVEAGEYRSSPVLALVGLVLKGSKQSGAVTLFEVPWPPANDAYRLSSIALVRDLLSQAQEGETGDTEVTRAEVTTSTDPAEGDDVVRIGVLEDHNPDQGPITPSFPVEATREIPTS